MKIIMNLIKRVKKYLVRAIIAFLHEKSTCGPCFEFESSSHRCSSLGCILTEQNRTEQNFYLQLNSGHTQVAYEIKHYICQK